MRLDFGALKTHKVENFGPGLWILKMKDYFSPFVNQAFMETWNVRALCSPLCPQHVIIQGLKGEVRSV